MWGRPDSHRWGSCWWSEGSSDSLCGNQPVVTLAQKHNSSMPTWNYLPWKTKCSQSIVLPRGEKLGKVCAYVFMPEEASCNPQRTEFESVHVQGHLQLHTSLLFLQDKAKSWPFLSLLLSFIISLSFFPCPLVSHRCWPWPQHVCGSEASWGSGRRQDILSVAWESTRASTNTSTVFS